MKYGPESWVDCSLATLPNFQLAQPVWGAHGYGARCFGVNPSRMREHATVSLLQICMSREYHLLWTPLLVVNRGEKEVVGGVKKEGQDERFHSHHRRPWQFPGLSFIPCALLGLASRGGYSFPLLDHVEFDDDHVSSAPAVLTGKHQCRVLPRTALLVWLAPKSPLIWRPASASCSALAANHLFPVLTSGCTYHMRSSGKSWGTMWSLGFPVLNSSVMDEKRSWRIPVAVV